MAISVTDRLLSDLKLYMEDHGEKKLRTFLRELVPEKTIDGVILEIKQMMEVEARQLVENAEED